MKRAHQNLIHVLWNKHHFIHRGEQNISNHFIIDAKATKISVRNTYLEEEVTDLFTGFPYVLNFHQRQAIPISNTPKGATTHVHLQVHILHI